MGLRRKKKWGADASRVSLDEYLRWGEELRHERHVREVEQDLTKTWNEIIAERGTWILAHEVAIFHLAGTAFNGDLRAATKFFLNDLEADVMTKCKCKVDPHAGTQNEDAIYKRGYDDASMAAATDVRDAVDNHGLRFNADDKMKFLQDCNTRQFEMIGDLRRELASKQTEVEGKLVVELSDLRAKVALLQRCNDNQFDTIQQQDADLEVLRADCNNLRNTWSPPPTYPPGPFHAIADLEQIRVLTAECQAANEALTYSHRENDALKEQRDYAERNLERYEDRLANQAAIIERVQRLSSELEMTVHGS